MGMVPMVLPRCCDVVKDRKNESHSQRFGRILVQIIDVVTLSKIEKMKAIHNIMVMLVILRRML